MTAAIPAGTSMREVPEIRARHEEHRERHERDDAGRAQVRLEDDERDDRPDEEKERHRALAQAPDARPARREPVRQVDRERQLGELRGMERGQPEERQPAGRPAHDTALHDRLDRWQQDEDEQDDRDDEPGDRQVPQHPVVHPHRHEEDDRARDGPDRAASRPRRRRFRSSERGVHPLAARVIMRMPIDESATAASSST